MVRAWANRMGRRTPSGFRQAQASGVFDRIADAIESPQQARFFKLAEARMTTAAEASELWKQAAENTKAMLTGMFGPLGIHVTFLDDASG